MSEREVGYYVFRTSFDAYEKRAVHEAVTELEF